MTIQVLMPQLGEAVEEGTITKWLKSPGDTVEEFEPLLEVNTDKVDTEIPSPAAGVLLEILAVEGETVKVGTVLASIKEPAEKTLPEGTPQEQVAPSPIESVPLKKDDTGQRLEENERKKQPSGRDLGFISPVVARLASENQIDLYEVEGSGLGGRITKKDVLAYLEKRRTIEEGTVQKPSEPARETLTKPSSKAEVEELLPLSDELVPHNHIRRMIAEHMVMSKHTSPHVTTVMEVDMSRVASHRSLNKENFNRDGVNLTFTAYFIAAAVSALKAYPIVNSSWREDGILIHRNINIGMATSLGEAGLIVPVIKNADQLSLLELARMINDLAQRARSKQLKPDEVRDGTFSITNHGISGSLFASPIINQPQCAILGVGAIQKRVVVVSDNVHGDTIAIRPMVYLSLTFDHRILDGAIADGFLGKVVETLANW